MGIEMPTLRSRPITLIYDIPISKTLTFWEGLKEGKIYATKCKRCKKAVFPPVADCPNCLSTEMEWFELSLEAEIEAFTHIVVRPLSFQSEKPYTVVIGRMKDGLRVLAWLTEVKISDVRVGMKAKLVVKPSPYNEPTFMFVPI
jgi:uncharacterized OB-fold protein